MSLDDIPRGDLITMLLNSAWYSGLRSDFAGKQGYSFDVREETAIRDVHYRDEPIFQTPEEALLAHWSRRYKL